MRFSTREDIDAPIDHVWAQITDVTTFERQAMRRGADVRRVDSGDMREGSAWTFDFTFRGKDRSGKAVVTSYDAPNNVVIESDASSISGVITVDLVALSPQRTRFAIAIDLSARSLPARLMLQSLKLAKANLTKRFKTRVADYAEEIERRFRRSA